MSRGNWDRGNTGWLYFVKLPSGPIKIGRTHDLRNRLAAIQVCCWEEFEWVVTCKGRGWEERDWHKAFREQHIRGEWFSWSAELEAAIRKECCQDALEAVRAKDRDEARKALGWPAVAGVEG